jgi:hypothetical protein
MTTDPTPVGTDGATRLCVIADLGDGELLADLDRIEELLLNFAGWETEAAEPGGDGWMTGRPGTPPAAPTAWCSPPSRKPPTTAS